MSFKPLDSLRFAYRRLVLYRVLLVWLLKKGYRHATRAIVVTPFLAVAAVALQAVAFIMISEVLRQIGEQHIAKPGQATAAGGGLLSTMARWLEFLPLEALVVPVALLLSLSALARYLSGTLAIRSHGTVAIGVSREVLDALSSVRGEYERWHLMRKFDRAHIAQMLLRDSSLCGMSIRLVLFNIINLLFLLAGAGFFLLVSPKVFLAILALGLVALAIAYPLNLGTIRVTRSFEETSKLRPAEVRKVIDAALNATADDRRSDMPVRLDPEVEAKVAHGLIGNFLVVERFNFLLAMLFMLAVTAVLYYMTHNVETLVIEPQILVLLFVAFRYTYAGMHGLLIAVTMINRFLPSIVRVHSFLTLTEALKEPQKQLPARPGADPGEPLRFAWRVAGNGEETVERGVLRPGSVCLLAEALRYRADLLYRWFDVLTADQGRFATLYRPAVAAWAEASAKAEACTGDPSPWVAEVQAAVEPRWRPRTVSMLQAIDQLAATGAPMIVLDNPSMLLLSDTAIALVRARLAHALVLLVVPWNPYIRPSAAFDVLMVSNGSAIGFACPSSKLTSERLTAAEAFYNSRPEVRQAAEEEVDDVQGL